jgi:type II secretory pathway component PulM
MRAPAAVAALQASLRRRNPRERLLITVAAVFVAGVALWFGLWQPLNRDLVDLRRTAATRKADVAFAARVAEEAPGLARTRRPVPTTSLKSDVETTLAATLGRPEGALVDVQDSQVRVTLPTVSFESLARVVEAWQRVALAQVVEARITARVEPGLVRAEVVLARDTGKR